MKPVAAGPDPAVCLGQVVDRLPRRRPIATMSVLAVTALVTALQFPFPAVRLALWHDRRRHSGSQTSGGGPRGSEGQYGQ
jgi:hypothetical protein